MLLNVISGLCEPADALERSSLYRRVFFFFTKSLSKTNFQQLMNSANQSNRTCSLDQVISYLLFPDASLSDVTGPRNGRQRCWVSIPVKC